MQSKIPRVIKGVFPSRFRNFGISLFWLFAFFRPSACAQGGPPYYTNDAHTPGNLQWEINLGYMPFLYPNRSIMHTPDVDINFGIDDRIQLTYENAWLRVDNSAPAKYGLGQDQLGGKWRFYDNRDSGFAMSLPQLSLNNPNNSVERGITPRGASLILPLEFSKKLGPININWEGGYNLVHLGPRDGWPGLLWATNLRRIWKWTRNFTPPEHSIPPPTAKRWKTGCATRYIRL